MAKYEVMYKYVHPVTKNPITNRETGYDAYGSFIEDVKGLPKPSSLPTESHWETNQKKVRSIMLGSKQPGIERNDQYLKDLSGFDSETLDLANKIAEVKDQIDLLEKEKAMKLTIKEEQTLIIRKHHSNFNGSNYPSSNSITATVYGDKKECYAPAAQYHYGNLKPGYWNHSQECSEAYARYTEANNRYNKIVAELSPLTSQLEKFQTTFDKKIENIAPQAEKNFVSDRNHPISPLYDMLFCFLGSKPVFSKDYIFKEGSSAQSLSTEIYVDSFVQVKGEPWFVVSVHGSLEAAQKAAIPLISKLGNDNVKIQKNVPMKVDISVK